tara:strand:+ start:1690 stop:1851 length:162 start_codon:yes stop_codon:yes gene_type:complete
MVWRFDLPPMVVSVQGVLDYVDVRQDIITEVATLTVEEAVIETGWILPPELVR